MAVGLRGDEATDEDAQERLAYRPKGRVSSMPHLPANPPPSAILLIGVDPSTLNPADWGETPEQNAMVQAALVECEQSFRNAGHDIDMCLLALNADLASVLAPRLRAKSWDVVVVGGGIRKPPELLSLFERVVNAVHRYAPQAAIAFNTKPSDSLEAAERWLAAPGDQRLTP